VNARAASDGAVAGVVQSEADRLLFQDRQHRFGYRVLAEQRASEVIRSGSHFAGELLNLGQLNDELVQNVDVVRVDGADAKGRAHRHERT